MYLPGVLKFFVLLVLVGIIEETNARHHKHDPTLASLKRELNLALRERRSKPNPQSISLSNPMANKPGGDKTPINTGKDGLDEVTKQKLAKAIEWVVGQRNTDWGWGQDTAHTVLALSLANITWFSEKNLEAQLVMKQFELELVLRLWKHKETPLTAGHLALNIMALVSLCRDPRAFYSKDLVALLEHDEAYVDFEVAFAQLSSCTSGRHVRKSKVRQLLNIIADQKRIHSVDTLSVVILALHCAQRQRHHDLRRYIDEALIALLKHQGKDGSFSNNLHSTALAAQAMTASDLSESWNATRAQEYIMSHQRPDGSFGSLFDTNAVLPILGGHTLLDAALKPCHHNQLPEDIDMMDAQVDKFDPKELEDPVQSGGSFIQKVDKDQTGKPKPNIKVNTTKEEKPVKMAKMTYIIWIGNQAYNNYNLTFTVPVNTTFLTVMKMAAEKDNRFEFSASKWANGYYIHTLAGQQEQKVGYWFWLLYRLPEPPVPGVKPDNKYVLGTGVIETLIQDGDIMLFWYHKI